MTINSDAFGNYYLGNYIAGQQLGSLTGTVYEELQTFHRTALGSDDRASWYSNVASNISIAWRPNIPEETLTGVITNTENPGTNPTLPANTRMMLFYTTSGASIHAKTLIGNGQTFSTNPTSLTSSVPIWATANSKSISLFMAVGGTAPNYNDYYFLSQGVLENSVLSYPENLYSFYLRVNTYGNADRSRGNVYSSVVHTVHGFGANANYDHIKLSDGTPTTSEVEFYLRDSITNNPYGFIPNVFKWKLDGSEVAPNLGDTVRLNLANATGYYAGQGIIYCKVVGRLGNNSETDEGGDYILMRTYG